MNVTRRPNREPLSMNCQRVFLIAVDISLMAGRIRFFERWFPWAWPLRQSLLPFAFFVKDLGKFIRALWTTKGPTTDE